MRTRLLVVGFAVTAIALLSGCGGTDRRHQVRAAAMTVPRSIELLSEVSAATIHFPRGLYALDSEDQNGYYYRAPGKVYQRSFGSRPAHEGGIFVSKRNQRKLRGYVVMPGGVTLVGNLSGANYRFRD